MSLQCVGASSSSSVLMQFAARTMLLSSAYKYKGSINSPPLGEFVAHNSQAKSKAKVVGVRAKGQENEEVEGGGMKNKQSLFGSIADALDFSQVRSNEDAALLEDARAATKSGERMSREQTCVCMERQYAALRRKIGGTYKDFFKGYVEADGEYVEDGWVDKTCKICKKDTKGEPRNVDNFGRYAHVACLEKAKSGNFFTRLFNR
eukprot:Gb_22634 [translate_table: standard]